METGTTLVFSGPKPNNGVQPDGASRRRGCLSLGDSLAWEIAEDRSASFSAHKKSLCSASMYFREQRWM